MSVTPGFYNLKVKKIQRETRQAVTVFFEIPTELKEVFSYKTGQYLTLNTEINGEQVRRAYSLCTAPDIDPDPAVTVKEVADGKMSSYINKVLAEGDVLEVMPPNGNFVVVPNTGVSKTYILFGGGSGITPLMGISKTVLAKEPDSRIYLIYANQNTESVIFKTVLEEMEKQHKERFKVIYSYDKAPLMWFGLKGYLTEKSISDTLKLRIGGSYASAHYYICGPAPMMDTVKKGLASLNIPGEQVFTEYFTATTDTKPATKQKEDTGFTGKAKVKVKLYGKESEIEVEENQTILNAANEAGLQPPYSCTVGVCTTCRAKVLKGKVEMLEREGLSDSEIEEGYVLTCQSLPRSVEIHIVYE